MTLRSTHKYLKWTVSDYRGDSRRLTSCTESIHIHVSAVSVEELHHCCNICIFRGYCRCAVHSGVWFGCCPFVQSQRPSQAGQLQYSAYIHCTGSAFTQRLMIIISKNGPFQKVNNKSDCSSGWHHLTLVTLRLGITLTHMRCHLTSQFVSSIFPSEITLI